MEKWTVKEYRASTNYRAKKLYQVRGQDERLVATHIKDQGTAHLIAQLPQLAELRYEWAGIINRLAHLALADEISSNDRDDVQEIMMMVAPYLDGTMIP